MKEAYCSKGKITVENKGYYCDFRNENTGMILFLFKEDIEKFLELDDKEEKFCFRNSYSNYMTPEEIKSIKIYLKMKNKRIKTVVGLLKSSENILDILRIFPIEELCNYVERNKLWKDL